MKNNPKKFWGYAQGQLKTRPGIPDLKKDDDRNSADSYTHNDSEKASEFLKYFSSVFTIENTENGIPHFPKQDYVAELNNKVITEAKV